MSMMMTTTMTMGVDDGCTMGAATMMGRYGMDAMMTVHGWGW